MVFLDGTSDLVSLVLPTLLLRLPDAFELVRVGVDALPKAIDLVGGETVMANEEVAHGYIEVTLSLWYRVRMFMMLHKTALYLEGLQGGVQHRSRLA